MKSKSAANPFGRKLRALREARAWSQEVLAGKSGVSQPMIHYLESGGKKPGFETVVRLAKALGVGVEEFA